MSTMQAPNFDTSAHRLLDDLDARHDQLLIDIDLLNTQVDAVLSQYVQLRPEYASADDEASHFRDDDGDEEGDVDLHHDEE